MWEGSFLYTENHRQRFLPLPDIAAFRISLLFYYLTFVFRGGDNILGRKYNDLDFSTFVRFFFHFQPSLTVKVGVRRLIVPTGRHSKLLYASDVASLAGTSLA